ncbi:hypothetical protein DYB34_010249, partial [Aphanomyces astaci]
KPSMTMDDVPITHLIIDPRRLGSKKFMDAIAMKHVLVVNPQWLVDSASEWQKQDEAKYAVSSSSQRPPSFAADTDVKLEQSTTVKVEGETATRTDVPVRPTLLAPTPENATESEEGRGGDDRDEYPPANLYDEIDASIDAESRLQEATTAVKGILSSPASIGVHKAKKSVRFAADVKEPSVQFSNLPKRSRGVQRKGGPLPARVTPKGVVESGGSLEFVTNLVSRKPRAASNAAPPIFNRVVVAPALASKRVETNDDDIFSRLAHLEEEEEEEDKPVKRKQSALFQDLDAAKKAKTLALQKATDDADDDLAVYCMTMGYAKKNRRHGKEDSDRMTLTDGDSLEDTARVEPTTSSSRPSLETSSGDDSVASASPPTVGSPVQGESPLPSTHAADAPMPCNADEDEHHVVSIPPRIHVTAGTSDTATTTVPVDLVECDDTIDEDDYNFRLKYRTEMTWQLVYFLIWNLLARHSWGLWIEFAGVVLAYSVVGVAGSLNPTRYPASWCLWSVRCYLWLNPLVQVYNALWFGRLFFLDNVFWFTYVTMLLNFGVLYCGYVSASEYYDNDLVHFMQRHFAASPSSDPKVDGDTDSSVAVDVGTLHLS